MRDVILADAEIRGGGVAARFEAEDADKSFVDKAFRDLSMGAHGRYFTPDSESLYNIGRIVDGQGGDVNLAEQTYDPWYDFAQDPEKYRDGSAGEPGRSQTVGDESGVLPDDEG